MQKRSRRDARVLCGFSSRADGRAEEDCRPGCCDEEEGRGASVGAPGGGGGPTHCHEGRRFIWQQPGPPVRAWSRDAPERGGDDEAVRRSLSPSRRILKLEDLFSPFFFLSSNC